MPLPGIQTRRMKTKYVDNRYGGTCHYPISGHKELRVVLLKINKRGKCLLISGQQINILIHAYQSKTEEKKAADAPFSVVFHVWTGIDVQEHGSTDEKLTNKFRFILFLINI
jgi:hypothetical protein